MSYQKLPETQGTVYVAQLQLHTHMVRTPRMVPRKFLHVKFRDFYVYSGDQYLHDSRNVIL